MPLWLASLLKQSLCSFLLSFQRTPLALHSPVFRGVATLFDFHLMPNTAATSSLVIPVISMTFTFEWKPAISCTFEDDNRSILDSHLTVSRLALPFAGGAATCSVSVPSCSQSNLVSFLSGFTCTVNLTPFDTGRVC